MGSLGNYNGTPEMQELISEHKKNKESAIAETLSGLASTIANILKTLPKDGKHNPFRKTYNRRPRNKQKKALAMAQIVINTRITEASVHRVASQPIPKFRLGGASKKGFAVVGETGAEEIVERDFKGFMNGTLTTSLQTGKPFTGFEKF